jgi:NAD(P)-dependent dehydrogenase (short-subunit alcohol dehydrogenase family)
MGIAIVTGGASGIGLALATALGERGLRLLLADLDPTALQAASDGLAATGVDVHTRVVDVIDPAALEALAAQAAALGPIAVVCCNAGVSVSGANLWETPGTTWDFALGVNLRGLVNTVQAFVPRLVDAGEPATVVVTASMAGMVSSPTSGAYAASKAAAVAVTKALRGELATVAPHVGVVLLNPGMVKTNLMHTSAARQPAGATPAELVEAGHSALNDIGVEPAEVARWVTAAIDEGRFWALPPSTDPFTTMLTAELTELEAAIHD